MFFAVWRIFRPFIPCIKNCYPQQLFEFGEFSKWHGRLAILLKFVAKEQRISVATKISDAEALKALKEGDRFLIDRLYRQFYPSIAQMVRTNQGNEDDARDLFQDAMMVVYSKAKSQDFRLSASLHTYLYAVARNLWLKKLRQVKGREVTIQDIGESIDESAANDWIEHQHEAKRQLLRRKLQELGEGCRDILLLSMTGMKIPQLVEKLKLSSELYARQRKFKCKEQLTRMVQADPSYKALMDHD
jgi:RNA polymerase sigma factor (sigma-70 family)